MLSVCPLSLSALWILTYFVLAPAVRERHSPSPPCGRGGNAGTEKWTNLLSVTQLENGRAGVQSQTSGLQSPHSQPLTYTQQSSEKKKTPFFTGDMMLYIKKNQNTSFFKKNKINKSIYVACDKVVFPCTGYNNLEVKMKKTILFSTMPQLCVIWK